MWLGPCRLPDLPERCPEARLGGRFLLGAVTEWRRESYQDVTRGEGVLLSVQQDGAAPEGNIANSPN
ncbi:MAG: hypothetical protein CBB97_20840 [Candidatus Endolissoclinum sp. TMED37]|nr:MAG: hypothetical protein CBB97_20840 [Candidatus Endolissoclinum sp. TMED37]